MAVRSVLAVKDLASRLFGQPVFVPAVGAGLRSFIDEVNRADAENPMYQHPEDFELWELASFDDEAGGFAAPAAGARVIARGVDVKKGGV